MYLQCFWSNKMAKKREMTTKNSDCNACFVVGLLFLLHVLMNEIYHNANINKAWQAVARLYGIPWVVLSGGWMFNIAVSFHRLSSTTHPMITSHHHTPQNFYMFGSLEGCLCDRKEGMASFSFLTDTINMSGRHRG